MSKSISISPFGLVLCSITIARKLVRAFGYRTKDYKAQSQRVLLAISRKGKLRWVSAD